MTRDAELAAMAAHIAAGKMRRLASVSPEDALDRALAAAKLVRAEARANPIKRRQKPRRALIAAALCVAAGVARAQLATPDPQLTPGAVRTTSAAETCAPGYSRALRMWGREQKIRITLPRYGIPASRAAEFEDDDLVPVCAGGDNASPLNHWPEPTPDARIKDRDEWRLCRLLCDRPSDTRLRAVQRYFQSGWWAR